MNIKVKLVASFGRLSTREPFLIAENESLNLTFETAVEPDFVLSVKNGKKRKEYRAQRSFEVPRDFLFGGRLEIVVSQYVGGTKANSWTVEPITLIETEAGFEAYAVIYDLEKRLTAIEAQLSDYAVLQQKILTLTKLCRDNAEATSEIIKIIKEN